MTTTLDEIVSVWLAAFWPFVRILAVMWTLPIVGHRAVPVRVKVGLALAITILVAPSVGVPLIETTSALGMAIVAEQVVVGVSIGLSARLVFATAEIAGQQVAQLMGLSFATLIDPVSGVNVPLVGQFYVVLTTLVFLALDGHLILIMLLGQSFEVLPVGFGLLDTAALGRWVHGAGWLFAAAVTLVLPALAALVAANLAFGVVTRAAPQLNIFAVGFPVTLLLGFMVLLVSLTTLVVQLEVLLEATIEHTSKLVSEF